MIRHSSLETLMALSDAAAQEIAEVLRKHVDRETLAQIVDELLEIRGDKDYRKACARVDEVTTAQTRRALRRQARSARQPRIRASIDSGSTLLE
jgi:hypothetical protein